MILYSADILGDPAGWSRAGACVIGGHARIYERKVGPSATWKDIILRHLVDNRPSALIDQAVSVFLSFRFRRPKGHYGARGLRPSAPTRHTGKPDLDNLAKLVLDAMACKQKGTRTETRILEDDKIIVELHAAKRWCKDDEEPGVKIEVES